MRKKPAWWNVTQYVDALEKLSQHEQLHFLDLNILGSAATPKQLRLNPMLPPLLDSIVHSKKVKLSVKLPLAIRLNRDPDVSKLCDMRGIARSGKAHEEFTLDGRLLVYSAFHDNGKTANRLLDAGFNIQQLDFLISLEIQREMDMPSLVRNGVPPQVRTHILPIRYAIHSHIQCVFWRRAILDCGICMYAPPVVDQRAIPAWCRERRERPADDRSEMVKSRARRQESEVQSRRVEYVPCVNRVAFWG